MYRVEDAIADRLAHFVHWSDSEALAVAEALARESRVDWDALTFAVGALDAADGAPKQRLEFALWRLKMKSTT